MKRLTALLFLMFTLRAPAQSSADTTHYNPRFASWSQKNISLLAGYNGCAYQYAELGIALNEFGTAGIAPMAWAVFASCEVRLHKEPVYAPKIGAWMGGGCAGMALGINLLYYTKPNNGRLCLRPEIGLGFDRFKFVYGYNILFSNSNEYFSGVNRNNLGIVYLFGIKKISEKGRFPGNEAATR